MDIFIYKKETFIMPKQETLDVTPETAVKELAATYEAAKT
jgi:hypothetical protein